MSKVQYLDSKTLRARYVEESPVSRLIQLDSNLGVLLLRDCVKERGKNDRKKITKTFQAVFTFDELPMSSNEKISANRLQSVIRYNQTEAFKISASFSTSSQRAEWVESTFRLVDENET